MNIVGIIPARMGSSRFPGKPLAKIQDFEMIGHVFQRSKMCSALNSLYVATCDQQIFDYVEGIGGNAVMTADTHERASDRTAEAINTIEKDTGQAIDIVVLIQGDEPMLYPEMIEESIKPIIEDNEIQVVNLMSPLKTDAEQDDPNEIKVVIDQDGFALYFSREPIPYRKKSKRPVSVYKQVCIIPFRREFLDKFNALTPTPLEEAESIDMLRILEHGFRVKMISTRYATYSVDTPDDLRKVEALMTDDPLIKQYTD